MNATIRIESIFENGKLTDVQVDITTTNGVHYKPSWSFAHFPTVSHIDKEIVRVRIVAFDAHKGEIDITFDRPENAHSEDFYNFDTGVITRVVTFDAEIEPSIISFNN